MPPTGEILSFLLMATRFNHPDTCTRGYSSVFESVGANEIDVTMGDFSGKADLGTRLISRGREN